MKKIICVLLAVCLLVLSVGCDSTKTTQSEDLGDSSATPPEIRLSVKETLDEILTQEEQQNYFDIIYNIEFGPPIGNYCYAQAPEAHSKLFSIGLKGSPMMIYEMAYHNTSTNEVHTNAEGSVCHGHFYNAIISMLRANECAAYDVTPKSNYYRENLYYFFKDAKELCPRIMSLPINSNAKIAMLRTYGILAIPYVEEEISKGNVLIKNYFEDIGLHLTTEEYAEIVCTYNTDSTPGYDELYDKVYSHPKAEDFDYKAWLDENEEDLNNLFKFIDAYCAEYDAEQNK